MFWLLLRSKGAMSGDALPAPARNATAVAPLHLAVVARLPATIGAALVAVATHVSAQLAASAATVGRALAHAGAALAHAAANATQVAVRGAANVSRRVVRRARGALRGAADGAGGALSRAGMVGGRVARDTAACVARVARGVWYDSGGRPRLAPVACHGFGGWGSCASAVALARGGREVAETFTREAEQAHRRNSKHLDLPGDKRRIRDGKPGRPRPRPGGRASVLTLERKSWVKERCCHRQMGVNTSMSGHIQA
eukprot:4727848-Prymnesium_polylepis.1